MPYVTTADKTEIYYKDWGKGRPVVLLHGWPLSADSWEDQALAFAEAGYRVIAYDRRGFGRSSQPWNGYDYDTLTDDLAAVLKHCKVSEAVAVRLLHGRRRSGALHEQVQRRRHRAGRPHRLHRAVQAQDA